MFKNERKKISGNQRVGSKFSLLRGRQWSIFVCVLLATLVVFTLSAAAASPPQPTYESPTTVIVGGGVAEWDLATDFFADMYRAGDPTKDVLAKLYLRYDCLDGTLYALVLTEPGVVIDDRKIEEHYINIDGGSPEVDDQSGNDGTPPDFDFYTVSGVKVGWEASLFLAEGTYSLNAHTQVDDDETAAVAQRNIPLVISCPRDWGDLPDPLYPTLSANNGPRHVIGDLYLGACIDAEADGQPNSAATGDDNGASGYTVGSCATVNDDEDGVTPASPWTNGPNGGAVTVTANQSGYLCAWFDFGSASGSAPDGVFDTFVSQPVSAGGQSVPFDIPAGTFESGPEFVTVYARFRLFESDPGCTLASGFTGEAKNGEVEDYRFEFRPTAVSLQSVVAQTTSGDGLWILVSLALLVGMGTFALLRRRQAPA